MKNQRNKMIAAIAKCVAATHFEVNQDIYQEDAEAYVEEGITEAKYMAGCGEHIALEVKENLAEAITDAANAAYEKLVRAKYKRLSKEDFVW